MSILKQFAKETAIYGFSYVLSRILHYVIFTIYLTYRFPNQSDYGIYTDLYAYAAILLILYTYRMETAFFRFGSKKEEMHQSFSTSFISLFISTICLTALLFAFAEPIANFLKYPDNAYYVRWFALIISFDALAALPFARLRLEQRPWRFMGIKLTNIFLTVGFVLFFLELCPRLSSRFEWINKIYDPSKKLDYVFLANLFASFMVFIFLCKEYFKTKWEWNAELWKKKMRYALPLVIVGLAGVINQSIAVPLQKYFLPGTTIENLTQAGIYGSAAKLALLLNIFTIAFNYAAEPFFFNNASRKDSKVVYAQVALFYTIIACLIALGLLLFIDVFQYILGPNYRQALFVVPILIIAYFFLGLYYNFSVWYKLTDKTMIGAFISFSAACLSILLNVLLLPRFGFVVSAWASVCAYAFMTLLCYLFSRKHFPIPYRIDQMGFYLITSVIIYFTAIFFNGFIEGSVVKFLFHLLLMGVFLVLIYFKEKNNLIKLFFKK